MTQAETAAHPVDIHVGAMIRMRRKLLGVSQDHLAVALGLSFQQVQKYERGSNRVSASKLYDSGRFLKVGTSYFFRDCRRRTRLKPPMALRTSRLS